MKVFKYLSGLLVVLLLVQTNNLRAEKVIEVSPVGDSLNVMVEFSLFNEDHKNKLFESALPHGFNVVKIDPAMFVRYRLYPKMEEILFFMHDSVAQTDEERSMYADTLLYIYKKAIQYDKKRESRWYVKKAYILDAWNVAEPDEVIAAYEEAITKFPDTDSFYKDRFGLYLAQNAAEDNDYKLKALELYQKLSDADPSNEVWNKRMLNLAEDQDELVEIRKKAWDMDKDNSEKCYAYGSLCMKAEKYEEALEALEFLVTKSPDVINYWNQLSKAYEKLGKTDKAINAYKTLTELQPDNRDNYLNLAIIYQKQGQLSVARSYLHKASKADPSWARPLYMEGGLYEQAARDCGFKFEDKLVYLLAYTTYARAARKNGQYKQAAADRKKALAQSIPSQEDYFFRKIKSGDELKIAGDCYGWIKKSVIIP